MEKYIMLLSSAFLIIGLGLGYQSILNNDTSMPIVKEPYTITDTKSIENLKKSPNTSDNCEKPANSHSTILFSTICSQASIVEGKVEENKASVPDDPSVNAWLNISAPLSSSGGTTIIYGHVSHHNKHGALYNMYSMKAGDLISTFDENGKETQWIVTGLQNYTKNDLPDELSNPTLDGERKLMVITCGGDFLGDHYEDNVVLTAVPLVTS